MPHSRTPTTLLSAIVLTIGLLSASDGPAQIYTCKAEDGSRVFSDQSCGDDAQLVPGTARKKKTVPAALSQPKPARVVKPAAELDELMEHCDSGDVPSCNAWTLGGGPSLLRERERQADADCEAGLLSACEEQYCREGMDEDCRARVMRTARLAGETWYVREEHYVRDAAVTAYGIRCFQKEARETRDIILKCSTQAGPNRCYLQNPQQGFAKLDKAASSYCAD
jgi:Domain of unknown function (DUF4124)